MFEVLELSESSKAEHLTHMASMRLLDVQKKARSMVVPTQVDEVKYVLRKHREPVTLFGENHLDRRERLKQVLAEAEIDRAAKGEGGSMDVDTTTSQSREGVVDDSARNKATATYTQCGEEMIAAREFLTTFSFNRAKERIQRETSLARGSDEIKGENMSKLCESAASLHLNASAVSEQRPLMKVRFDPSGKYIATGSLGNHLKIWDVNSLQPQKSLVGHTERIMCVAWHPKAMVVEDSGGAGDTQRKSAESKKKRKRTNSIEEDMPASGRSGPSLLASASADGKCLIWDCNSSGGDSIGAFVSLSGHVGSVTQCAFHPAGKHVVTAGVDYSWRYWDVERGTELMLQDGHPSECTSIAPHPDGSLLLSADSSGYVFLWDLRSGKRILVLEGHADKVTSSCFHPNGYDAATASLDNMIRFWDLRKQRCKYQLPAHSSAITDTRFSLSGALLLSSSFDGSINVYNGMVGGTAQAPHYPRLASLKGHTGKVMGADFSPDEQSVVSVGFDRTIKLWTC